jgi:hypothetical protein
MNFIRDKMVMKKTNPTNIPDSTINKGMIHVFTQEVLIPHGGEILEKYELLGQPLLLVYMDGKRTLVALNALYETPKQSQDRDMDAYYHSEILELAVINNAKPFMAYFAVTHNHKSSEPDGHDCTLCLSYKGTAPVK